MPSSQAERDMAADAIPPHYVALMHTEIALKGGRVGETSITSLDIHDVARSSATYGIKNYFIVSPLKDQQVILKTFLDFWHSEEGKQYNKSRFDAVELVQPASQLADVIAAIEEKEGKKPLLIATSAKPHQATVSLDYASQGRVWQKDRPVLLLFGTGQGLSDELLKRCDFLLLPIEGMTPYNHLSVRAAVAITLDRWLGLQPRNVAK